MMVSCIQLESAGSGSRTFVVWQDSTQITSRVCRSYRDTGGHEKSGSEILESRLGRPMGKNPVLDWLWKRRLADKTGLASVRGLSLSYICMSLACTANCMRNSHSSYSPDVVARCRYFAWRHHCVSVIVWNVLWWDTCICNSPVWSVLWSDTCIS